MGPLLQMAMALEVVDLMRGCDLTISDNFPSTTDPDAHTTWTVYDALNRVVTSVSADGSGGAPGTPGRDPTYATTTGYDEVGNVSRVTDPDANTTSWSYDRLGRKTAQNETVAMGYSTATTVQTTTASEAYQYDADGNRTVRYIDVNGDGVLDSGDTDVTIYAWDYRDRLTTQTHYTSYANYQSGTSNQVVAFTYDYAGRMIRRGLDDDGTAGPDPMGYTYTVYDGQNPYLQVTDANALKNPGSSTTPSVALRYLYAPAVDQILATDDFWAATVRWGLADYEGTIRDVVDLNGTPVANGHIKFDSFGNPISNTPVTGFLFGLNGMRYDPATNEYLTETVPYDPVTGQRLSQDPLGFASGTTNFTAWAGNSPVGNVDPSGECDASFAGYSAGTALSSTVLGSTVIDANTFTYPSLMGLEAQYSGGTPQYAPYSTIAQGPEPSPPSPITDMAGLTQLVADTQFNGDLGKANARMDKYVTDLAFVLKNPTLGNNPGCRGSWLLDDTPVAQVYPFSDEITDADREAAKAIAIRDLPDVLTGENPNDPLTTRVNGMLSQLRQLSAKSAAHNGFLVEPLDADAYDDLTGWAGAFSDAYRRATMGETTGGQFLRWLGQPDNMNALIGSFGGFAGVGASGQRVGRAQSVTLAKVNEGVGGAAPGTIAAESEWAAPQGLRLPTTNGQWSGTPGNSMWQSNILEVNQITGNRAIPFNQGYIDLSYYKFTQYAFANLNGTNADFKLGDAQLAIDLQLNSTNAARLWRSQNNFTWHHVEDGQTLQLVPTVLNDIPHQGGAAILRGN